jgi:anti-sigma regulatory factor (Ser/Thr protein kinase)
LSESRRLPGTLDALAVLPDVAAAGATLAGLSDRQRAGLRLAIDEVVTNAITHGYGEAGRQGAIDVDWSLDAAGRLVLGIEDDGVLFDPTTVPEPDQLDLPLAERPIGGLGLVLVRRSVDELRYTVREGRNRTELIIAPVPHGVGDR